MVLRRLPRLGMLAAILAGGCTAGARTDNGPDTVLVAQDMDSIVLERTVCFGRCPAYRLRVASTGAVLFEPRNPDGPPATDNVSPQAFAQLVLEATRIRLDSYPASIQDDRRLCALGATDHPSIILSTYAGAAVHSVNYYTGCHAAENDRASEERLAALARFAAQIDSVTRSPRWTGVTP